MQAMTRLHTRTDRPQKQQRRIWYGCTTQTHATVITITITTTALAYLQQCSVFKKCGAHAVGNGSGITSTVVATNDTARSSNV